MGLIKIKPPHLTPTPGHPPQTSESRASLASVANGSGGAETPSARSTADGTHRSLFPSESAMALDSLMPTTPR